MGNLQYGLYVLNFGESSYPRTLAELARDAERVGWDGFFLSDTVMFQKPQRAPVVDSFTALAAIAVSTRRIRIGTTVTALPRRRPWIVARQTVSIDHLSNGRFVLGVGLGDPPNVEFETFGEDSDSRVRGEKLDEALEILVGLWSGEEFSYQGRHYRIDKATFLPRPMQKPRIPVWVGGSWPNKPPFRRAARWDGVIPVKDGRTDKLEPQNLREILAYIRKLGTSRAPFDVVVVGSGKSQEEIDNRRRQYEQEGITWWLKYLVPYRDSPKEMREQILQGPPRQREK